MAPLRSFTPQTALNSPSLSRHSLYPAQLITLTLVTNISGLPFAGGFLGAVRLEPEGLDLWGAATLQVSLPPTVDRFRSAKTPPQKMSELLVF